MLIVRQCERAGKAGHSVTVWPTAQQAQAAVYMWRRRDDIILMPQQCHELGRAGQGRAGQGRAGFM
jgi:hypothetical protein